MKGLSNLVRLNRGGQRRLPFAMITGVLALVAVVLAACGGTASTATPPAQTAVPPAPTATPVTPGGAAGQADVAMQSFQFQPKELTVKVGTTVKWTNNDQAGHTVTSDTGVFDSGNLGNGQTFSFTFSQAGEFPYYCTFHGGKGGTGMAGKISVVP
jgi:plastocyanin